MSGVIPTPRAVAKAKDILRQLLAWETSDKHEETIALALDEAHLAGRNRQVWTHGAGDVRALALYDEICRLGWVFNANRRAEILNLLSEILHDASVAESKPVASDSPTLQDAMAVVEQLLSTQKTCTVCGRIAVKVGWTSAHGKYVARFCCDEHTASGDRNLHNASETRAALRLMENYYARVPGKR